MRAISSCGLGRGPGPADPVPIAQASVVRSWRYFLRRPRRRVVPRILVFSPIAEAILTPTRRNRREPLYYAGRASIYDQTLASAGLADDVGDIDVAPPNQRTTEPQPAPLKLALYSQTAPVRRGK